LAAADLLRFCAFLAPDAIPEELFKGNPSILGENLGRIAEDQYSLVTTIGTVCRYSLMRRDEVTRTLTIHRLVRDAIIDAMDSESLSLWATRAVRTVSQVFPSPEFVNWPLCDRLLPHALVCYEHIVRWNLESESAAELLHRVAYYTDERGRFSD